MTSAVRVLFLIVLCSSVVYAEERVPTGVLKGRILSLATKAPIAGAAIVVEPLKKGAVSNAKGEFSIDKLPVGAYTVRITSVGYTALAEPDVIIRSNRVTFLEKELIEVSIATDSITVYGSYYRSASIAPASTVEMSAEELRRAPGSAGDINRALYALPGVVQADDEANDLIVRGGAPFENGFYIDNIFTPNINHFPQEGASGGNITMLNIDFVKSVALSAGGFDASYGNRLSSIVDVRFREGNRESYDGQIDLNMTGFGGSVEGPVGNGSFLLSAKHSYFDLITDLLDLGVSPQFYDIQGKVDYRLSESHTLTLLDVFGRSEFGRDRERAAELEEYSYGKEIYTQNTAGVNWRALWESGYSNTSLSYATIDASNDWSSVETGNLMERRLYVDKYVTLRHASTLQFSPERWVDIGTEWQYRNLSGSGESGGGRASALSETTIGGVFASYSHTLWGALTAHMGVRAAYFSEPDKVYVEPRLRLVYTVDDALSFHTAYAVVHQSAPPFLTLQDSANTRLNVPQAQHIIAGFNYLLSEDTRLTVEAYAKEYDTFPLSPLAPVWFVVDDVAGDESEYNYYGKLVDSGKAYTRGIELMLQKKFANELYGMVSATWFRSRYRDLTGEWRNRLFDNRFVFALSAGWKPNDDWELSFRWVYAGGKAYTPIDVEASRAAGSTVRDRSRIMDAYYPAYHSLNVRVDRRFYFMNTNLIVYLNILNAYNRDNVRSYYWNGQKQAVEYNSMLPVIPILGVEYEF